MKKLKALLAAVMMAGSLFSAYSGTVTAEEAATLGGTYLIKNVNSGIYLNAVTDKIEDGTNVNQWSANEGYSYNVWKLEEAGNGYYKIYTMAGDGKSCLTVENTGKLSGDNICLKKDSGSDSQLYKLSANSDGSFKLLTKSSDGKQSVEVINASTEEGANVQQWEVNGVNCQDWQLIPIKYTENESLSETKSKVIGDSFTAGDLNDDGIVNVFDSIIAKKLIINGNANDHQKNAGNVNADESFEKDDVKLLQKYLVRAEKELKKPYVEVKRIYSAVDGSFVEGVSETTNAGFQSESYLNLDNKAGVEASWNVTADTAGIYDVVFRYANGGTASRNVKIYVNNQLYYYKAEFKQTGAWTTWAEERLNIPLKKGVNKITIVSDTADGAPNIDNITVSRETEGISEAFPIEPIIGVPEKTTDEDPNGRTLENLGRGVSAAYTGSGMLVSWRSLATDTKNTSFKLYKNGEFVTEIGAGEATNYFVSGATGADYFTIDTFVNGVMTEFAQPAVIMGTKNSGQSGAYMDIPLDKPSEQTMPDGTTCTYTPNDCSVGDVDGDGQYEIIVKWDPSNSQDNSKHGYTGTVFLDCYKLDGTKLWRIDLGKNIRAGAHYTQFQVYDFDCDGKAELMCKTSDGTYDGKGKCIGNANADYRDSNGRILTGNEYLTLFDGLTGQALDTIDYEPGRGSLTDESDETYFGDKYGNRCDRFLSAVAYFDGKTPSAVFCRGYYARTALAAYDVKDKKIVKRWMFDTKNDSSNPYYGQGNHSLVTMDVDSDGKDELIYGSCCIDDNGKGLWSTGLKHGDCMQAGDLIPERPGLEIFQVHEEIFCAEVHDAATGEIIWKVDGADDVGRGIALNFDVNHAGMEFTSVADGKVYAYNPTSKKIEEAGYNWSDKIKWSMNSAVWWDGDLEREALDRAMVEKPGETGPIRLFTGDGASFNNGSKSNASITCDLFGDWREEMIFPANDGTTLRVFGTTFTTEYKITTLMHDSQYRSGVSNENVGYNQAPNTSFFLGTGYDLPEKPGINTAKAK